MTREHKGELLQVDPLGGALQRGKYSEMFLEYAAPLLEDGHPPDVVTLRSVLRVAEVCWNAAWLASSGDGALRTLLDATTAGAPPEGRELIQQLLRDRIERFGGVPVLLEIEVVGDRTENARVVARARLPTANAATQPTPTRVPTSSQPPAPPRAQPPGAMMPFDALDFELAKTDSRMWLVGQEPGLAPGTYVLREYFCTEPECDCRRVILRVHHVDSGTIAATLNYAFEPAVPSVGEEPQLSLDPLNPQGAAAPRLLAMFEKMVTDDRAYHARLVRHYERWKRVVDDPHHPDHAKLRSAAHDDPAHVPAFPRRELSQRQGAKIGPNESCPCGSGRKYKKCCRQ
jgi:hypothetical protein